MTGDGHHESARRRVTVAAAVVGIAVTIGFPAVALGTRPDQEAIGGSAPTVTTPPDGVTTPPEVPAPTQTTPTETAPTETAPTEPPPPSPPAPQPTSGPTDPAPASTSPVPGTVAPVVVTAPAPAPPAAPIDSAQAPRSPQRTRVTPRLTTSVESPGIDRGWLPVYAPVAPGPVPQAVAPPIVISAPSGFDPGQIPAPMLAVYRSAGVAFGIDWTVLAAIGSVESDHGRSVLPGVVAGVNAFGCCAGPMQFNLTNGPPSTWDTFGRDENRDGVASPYDPRDAVPAAARKLVADGAPGDWNAALLAYNNDPAYVREVLARAAAYRAMYGDTPYTAPLDSEAPPIGLPYEGTHTLGNWQSDNAIDLSAAVGTPVRAVCDGTIGPNLGWSSGGDATGSRFAGLRLTLDCGTNRVWYGHLSSYTARVAPGTRVRRGQVLGASGAANGVQHLHIALEFGDPRVLLPVTNSTEPVLVRPSALGDPKIGLRHGQHSSLATEAPKHGEHGRSSPAWTVSRRP